MYLGLHHISKIEKKISIGENKFIVMIDMSGNKNFSLEEKWLNIYCVNNRYEIMWQVKEKKPEHPFKYDTFVHVGKEEGEIIAYRFSGFEYKIDPATGEAKCIGYNKG